MFDTGGVENTPGPSTRVRTLLVETQAAVQELRRAEAWVIALVDEIDAAGAASETGHRSTERLLEELVRVDRSEATTLLRQGALVVERPGFSGAAVEPVLPATAAALRDGDVGRAHLAVIAATMQRVSAVPHLPVEVVTETERQLVVLAGHRSPRQLARDGAEILLRLDPDGELAPETDRPDQELQLATGRDGSLRGKFRFADPEAAETLRTAIDALTAPPDPTENGTMDRCLAERRGAALQDMAADTLGLDRDRPDGAPCDGPASDEPASDEPAATNLPATASPRRAGQGARPAPRAATQSA